MENTFGAICAPLSFCLKVIQSILQKEPTQVSGLGVQSSPPTTLHSWHPHKTLTVSFRLSNWSHQGLFLCDPGIPINQQSSDDTRHHFTSKWANQIPGLVVSDPILPSDDRFQETWLKSLWSQIRCLASQNIQPWGWADMTQFLKTFTLSWCYSLEVFNHDCNPLEFCSFWSKCITCYVVLYCVVYKRGTGQNHLPKMLKCY